MIPKGKDMKMTKKTAIVGLSVCALALSFVVLFGLSVFLPLPPSILILLSAIPAYFVVRKTLDTKLSPGHTDGSRGLRYAKRLSMLWLILILIPLMLPIIMTVGSIESVLDLVGFVKNIVSIWLLPAAVLYGTFYFRSVILSTEATGEIE
jgi:hypothetical protein